MRAAAARRGSVPLAERTLASRPATRPTSKISGSNVAAGTSSTRVRPASSRTTQRRHHTATATHTATAIRTTRATNHSWARPPPPGPAASAPPPTCAARCWSSQVPLARRDPVRIHLCLLAGRHTLPPQTEKGGAIGPDVTHGPRLFSSFVGWAVSARSSTAPAGAGQGAGMALGVAVRGAGRPPRQAAFARTLVRGRTSGALEELEQH